MTALQVVDRVLLPPGQSGGFDHGDVDQRTGRVFVAHTDFGTVDVIDPESLSAIGVIGGCPEGSGVLCAGDERLVFAASRGGGKVLLIDADRMEVVGEFDVGPKPNGLAWDPGRRRLLVADVDPADQSVRLMGVPSSGVAARTRLPGRPRWCVFDELGDRFLVNIREPAALLSIAAVSGEITRSWPISSAGPHGLDVDPKERRAFIACDGGQLVVLDLESGTELSSIRISGVPDAIWFNPLRQRVYVAVGKPGLIDVVDIEVGGNPDVIAYDSRSQHIYVASEDGVLAVIGAADPIRRITQGNAGPNAHTVAVDPSTHLVYLPMDIGGKPTMRIVSP